MNDNLDDVVAFMTNFMALMGVIYTIIVWVKIFRGEL